MATLLLTGATGDIGKQIKSEFESNGDTVIAPTREEMDLAEPASIDQYMAALAKDSVDIFIHCAGYNCPAAIEALPLEELQKTIQVNALSFFSIVQALVPFFRKKNSGYILGISSIYAIVSRPKRLSYTASKEAMNGMVKTMALEFGQDNIIVNAIAPGFIDTQLTRKNNPPEKIKMFIDKIPLGRLGTEQEIAKASYWLCSKQNTFIHGQCIVADGGYIIGGFEQ